MAMLLSSCGKSLQHSLSAQTIEKDAEICSSPVGIPSSFDSKGEIPAVTATYLPGLPPNKILDFQRSLSIDLVHCELQARQISANGSSKEVIYATRHEVNLYGKYLVFYLKKSGLFSDIELG
jgi:hypothetical protein